MKDKINSITLELRDLRSGKNGYSSARCNSKNLIFKRNIKRQKYDI